VRAITQQSVNKRGGEHVTAAGSADRMLASMPVPIGDDPERPHEVAVHLGPNWFTTVMGTGIVAVAAVTLPLQVPGLHVAALLV
jgi:hypothetical protein